MKKMLLPKLWSDWFMRKLKESLRNKAKQDKLMQSPEFQTEYNQYLDELNRRGDGADNRD